MECPLLLVLYLAGGEGPRDLAMNPSNNPTSDNDPTTYIVSEAIVLLLLFFFLPPCKTKRPTHQSMRDSAYLFSNSLLEIICMKQAHPRTKEMTYGSI